MVSWVRKRMPMRRKLQTQRSLTRRKSVKKSSIVMDAMLHIYLLKLKLEAVHKQYLDLMAIKTKYLDLIKQIRVPNEEVKVEKIEEGFHVRVTCEKAEDTLVSILDAFDEMGLNILQAKVSCNSYFAMEAIAAHVSQNQHKLDVTDITQAIIKATQKQD